MTQSSAFGQLYIGDYANTLTEVGGYVPDGDFPLTRVAIDNSTFAAGGNAAVKSTIQGAIQAPLPITFLLGSTIWNLLAQIIAARTGVTITHYAGKNAAPTYGDTIYKGT